MKLIFRALALAVFSLLAACATVSVDNPIGISAGAQADARLFGGWKVVQFGKDAVPADKNEGAANLFFLPRKEGGLQAMLVMTAVKPDDNQWMSFDVVTGKAGERTVINAHAVLDNGEPVKNFPKGYQPFLYRLGADGGLTLFNVSVDAIKDAMENGRIAGALEDGNYRITSDPQTLDAFFGAASPMLFESDPFLVLQPLK